MLLVYGKNWQILKLKDADADFFPKMTAMSGFQIKHKMFCLVRLEYTLIVMGSQ